MNLIDILSPKATFQRYIIMPLTLFKWPSNEMLNSHLLIYCGVAFQRDKDDLWLYQCDMSGKIARIQWKPWIFAVIQPNTLETKMAFCRSRSSFQQRNCGISRIALRKMQKSHENEKKKKTHVNAKNHMTIKRKKHMKIKEPHESQATRVWRNPTKSHIAKIQNQPQIDLNLIWHTKWKVTCHL